ncbi:MAG: hypothetical protein IT257_04035 [Chitinophagaceae bacterium]|nr:hypothetical protein [Chitinophagaceae bacterium]
MYSITSNINNRRQWICELKEGELPQSLPEFVVEFDKTNLFNLFSIPAGHELICFEENNFDVRLQDMEVQFSAHENVIEILLASKSKPESATIAVPPKRSFFDSIGENEVVDNSKELPVEPNSREEFTLGSQDLRFICTYSPNGIYIDAKITRLSDQLFDLKNLQVNVRFATCIAGLKINICHPKQFLGIALDFGSEASQLAVSSYLHNLSNPVMPLNEDLFDNVRNLMISKQNATAESQAEYYQQEKGTRFFKSVFFVKSDLGAIDAAFNSDKFLRTPEEHLKILVDKSSGKLLTQEENKHYQLPNLKIIHGHHDLLEDIKFKISRNNYPASVTLDHIVEKVHNSVLMYLLESYIQKDFAIHEKERFVRITLLVPNIYDSESVSHIQQNIRAILQVFQQKNLAGIAGFEVLTISESDAALVGYMSKPDVNIMPGKQYVIIDAGKGTTDFSVVKTGHDDIFKILPVYRNGFAGAGNLITNALFETLIHYIREQNNDDPEVQHAIRAKIIEPLKNDLAVRNEFFNELERLKKKFTENKSVKTQWDQASSGSIKLKDINGSGVDINTIIDILKRIEQVADFYQYIEIATETITEKVVSSLEILKNSMPDIHYEGVIFTGRGFLFQPLYLKLEQKIMSRLQVPKAGIFLLKNNELKDVCIKGVFNRSMQVNSEVIGYPIQKIRKHREAASTPAKTAASTKTSVYERVRKLLGSIEGEETTYVFSQSTPLNVQQLKNSTFQIGAKSYSIPNDDHFYSSLTPESVIKIEYTSGGYVLRHLLHGKVIRVNGLQNTFELADIDKNMIIPSLFPNYINTDYLESMNAEIAHPKQETVNHTSGLSTPKTSFDDLKF